MTVVLFEDDRVPRLFPVTTGRAAFDTGCGGATLSELVRAAGFDPLVLVRPHLRAVQEADRAALGSPPPATGRPLAVRLLLNGRLVPHADRLEQLLELARSGATGVIRHEGRPAAILAPTSTPLPREGISTLELHDYFQSLPLPALDFEWACQEHPHDLIRHHVATLQANLAWRLRTGTFTQRDDGAWVGSGARIGPFCVIDSSKGPVVVDRGATIGPYCYLQGPLYVGPGARVIEHSALKDGVALGKVTKVGGEVECSIIEPYTNKQHHGFLGHSYLGSWVNLGAGTCNSDLKNTYGLVNMEYGGVKTPTGMQFVGAIIGDYAKTAINTGIFTGKTVGVCSMLYGFVTTNVPSFVNYARLFGQVTEAPVEVMVATQARMFARRDVQQRPCDMQLLHDMYELTRHERQLAGEPLQL